MRRVTTPGNGATIFWEILLYGQVLDIRLGRLHRRRGRVEIGVALVEFLPTRDCLGEEILLAIKIELSDRLIGLGLHEIRYGLVQLGVHIRRRDFGPQCH